MHVEPDHIVTHADEVVGIDLAIENVTSVDQPLPLVIEARDEWVDFIEGDYSKRPAVALPGEARPSLGVLVVLPPRGRALIHVVMPQLPRGTYLLHPRLVPLGMSALRWPELDVHVE